MSLRLIFNEGEKEKEIFNFQEQIIRSENEKKLMVNLSIDFNESVLNNTILTSEYLKEFLPYFNDQSISNIKILNEDNSIIYTSTEYNRIESSRIGLPDGEGDFFGTFLFESNLEEEA